MTTTTVEPTKSTLSKVDRCDKCGAQAFARVAKPSTGFEGDGVLDFCGHHFSAYEDNLLKSGFLLLADDRELVNSKPSPSANV